MQGFKGIRVKGYKGLREGYKGIRVYGNKGIYIFSFLTGFTARCAHEIRKHNTHCTSRRLSSAPGSEDAGH